MLKGIKFDISTKIVLFIIAFYTIAQVWIGLPEQIISWDAFGYYLYLPYTFIYQDLSFSDLTGLSAIVNQYDNTATFYQLVDAGNGNMIIKYPVGVAILELPFFLLGHLIALILGSPLDGFSKPYEIMVFVGNTFYLVIGIIYLRKLLVNYFTPAISAIVLVIVFIGTNLLATGLMQMGNSHIPLFALHAIGLYLVHKWHLAPTNRLSLTLGALIGLMIISRPTEILFLIIPFFWGVNGLRSLAVKYRELLLRHTLKITLLAISIVLVGFIQLAYWKVMTGNWFFYSYDNAGEGFELFAPYTLEYLFSFRKGWFVYTPVMIFGVIGVLLAMKRNIPFRFSLFIFLFFNVWILSSWSCWWYAGSFSQRSIVQSYPEMALGLGVFLSSIKWNNLAKWGLGSVFTFFTLLNVFQTWQMGERIIHPTRMTAEYYWSIFGKTQIPKGAENLLMVERATVQKAFPKNISNYKRVKEILFEPVIQFDENQEFVDFPKFTFNTITQKDHAWIKVTGQSSVQRQGEDEQFLMVTTFAHEGAKYSYVAWSPTEMKSNIKDSAITEIEMWYLTPEVRNKKDEFIFEIWNRAKSSATIRELKIEVFEKK